jgi:hypothetical protein
MHFWKYRSFICNCRPRMAQKWALRDKRVPRRGLSPEKFDVLWSLVSALFSPQAAA